jgi:dTDP-4-amino-4,6-dideoxygalactose transaminase
VRRAGSLGISEDLAGSVVSLPLYPELTDDEVETVQAVLSAS